MSLISLTFGEKRNCFSVAPQVQVTRPADCIKIEEGVENRIEVVKSCFFFKQNEPYIVGKNVSGAVAERMRGTINGKCFEIIDLDSKYGNAGIAKEGMVIGLSVRGLENETIEKGAFITFKTEEQQAAQ